MKKKRDDSVSLSLKVTRIMKITLILILVGVIQVSAQRTHRNIGFLYL